MTPVNYQRFSRILLKEPNRLQLAPYASWIALPVFHTLLNLQTSQGPLVGLLSSEWFVSITIERYSP